MAAYRFPYLLAGDSLIFKQESIYNEHFYAALIPWKHFIPVKKDLSDLLEKLEWAKNNDQQVRAYYSLYAYISFGLFFFRLNRLSNMHNDLAIEICFQIIFYVIT